MMMMTPMWLTLLKVLVIFLALFTSTTTADSASFMPIPTQRGGTSQGLNRNQKHNQNQSPIPDPNRHYHQYHSLSQSDQDQYFKNVSAEVQSDQPQHLQRHPSDTFIFPDSPLATHRPPLTPPQPLNNTLSPCRNNSSDQLKTFCTEVDDYPNLSKFKAKLEQTYAKFFMTNIQPTDVSSRVGGDPADMYLCKSNSRVIFPKLGQKTDNTWELIVNDEEHKQGILIEECLGADKPCDFASNFPNHYQATCKQHYIQQTMVSIQGDDVGQAPFRFPSCCKCALKIV
ncbi:protein spaetzle isoform X7 [Drosophila subpulchrella]|uniref:protein spaetzle isoform X7 n=1 Tax=Drosophila subpulchrella TaxID=1486046 RepID=UPI0018A1A25D|nr:protein spaetzle isoform X7 [Drosophila subpulchrella]